MIGNFSSPCIWLRYYFFCQGVAVCPGGGVHGVRVSKGNRDDHMALAAMSQNHAVWDEGFDGTVDGSEIRRSPPGMVLKHCR